jgi:cyclohexanone monooxygenase
VTDSADRSRPSDDEPGASYDYCYYFSRAPYSSWQRSEKYATQPELLRYLNHVADQFDTRRHFRFPNLAHRRSVESENAAGMSCSPAPGMRCHVSSSSWRPAISRSLAVRRSRGWTRSAASGLKRQLDPTGTSRSRAGASGSSEQVRRASTVPVAAKVAEHVYVFQRSPNFTVPAHNGPMDKALWGDIRDHLEREREVLLGTLGGRHQTPGAKIRAVVGSAEIAQKLAPRDHPIGARRPVVDSGYHAAFNRSNVTLVDLRETPLERITAHGI